MKKVYQTLSTIPVMVFPENAVLTGSLINKTIKTNNSVTIEDMTEETWDCEFNFKF